MSRPAAIVAAAALLLVTRGAAAQIRFDDRADVSRVLVDARVVDDRGMPIGGLDAGDFQVDVDGRPARLEWVRWVGEPANREAAEPANRGNGEPVNGGRTVVFLFQKSLVTSRAEGFVRMMRESALFVDRLGESDRVAIVVHDSRLRLWLDFTSDHELLRRTLGGGLLQPPPQHEREDVSLASELAAYRPERSYSFEGALSVIAGALAALDGAKSLVLMGYGFGDFRPAFGDPTTAYAQLNEEYTKAREALVSARVTVFALDITQADFHTFETALVSVADATGGFYAKTHEFPALAMDRLEGALAGHYVLSIETPRARRGRHELRVRVRTLGATVLARRHYVD